MGANGLSRVHYRSFTQNEALFISHGYVTYFLAHMKALSKPAHGEVRAVALGYGKRLSSAPAN